MKPARKRGGPDEESEALGQGMWLYVVGYALLVAGPPGRGSASTTACKTATPEVADLSVSLRGLASA